MNKQTKIEMFEKMVEDLEKIKSSGFMHLQAHEAVTDAIFSLRRAKQIVRKEMRK